MTTSHEDVRRQVQQELAVLLAPTGRPLPLVELSDRVLWAWMDHTRDVLQVHPRLLGIDPDERGYLLAEAVIQRELGPEPVWVRAHPYAGLAAAGLALVALVAAPGGVAVAAALVAATVLGAGAAGRAWRRHRVTGLLWQAWRPQQGTSDTPGQPRDQLDP